MAQAEVLALVAQAVDNASGPLRKVRAALDEVKAAGVQLDAGQSRAFASMRSQANSLINSSEGFRNVSKRTQEMGAQFKQTGGHAANMAAMVSSQLSPAITRLVSIAVGAVVSIAAFRRSMEESRTITEFARSTGFAASQVKLLGEAGEEFNVPAEKMRQVLAGLGTQLRDLRYIQGGDLWQKMLPARGAVPELARAVGEARQLMVAAGNDATKLASAQSESFNVIIRGVAELTQRVGEAEAKDILTKLGLAPELVNLSRRGLSGLNTEVERARRLVRTLDPAKVEAFDRAWRGLRLTLEGFTNEVIEPMLPGMTRLMTAVTDVWTGKAGDYWLLDKLREAQRALQPVWADIQKEFETEIERLKKYFDSVVWPSIKIGVKFALEDLRTFATKDWPRIKTELSTIREELTGFFEQGKPIDWGKVLGFGNIVDQFQAMVLRLERRIEEFRAYRGTGKPGALEEAGRREMEHRERAFDFGEVRRWYGSEFSERARISRLRRGGEAQPQPPQLSDEEMIRRYGTLGRNIPGYPALIDLFKSEWFKAVNPLDPENIERERKARSGMAPLRFMGGEVQGGSAIDAFQGGGLYGLMKQRGYGGDRFNEAMARFWKDPLVTMALSTATPGMLTPGGMAPGSTMGMEAIGGALDWRQNWRKKNLLPERFSDVQVNPLGVEMKGARSSIADLSGGYSENIEDRRAEEKNTTALDGVTGELRRLNDFLLGRGAPGGGDSGPGGMFGGAGLGGRGFGGGAGGGVAGGVPGMAGGPSGPAVRGTAAEIAKTEGAGVTAEQAGITPKFPTGNVNWKNLDAEYLSRLNAAYDAMPEDVRRTLSLTSGFRSHEQQAEIYARSGQGSRFAAAPPGSSYHEYGTATDIAQSPALAWLHQQGGQFGLTGILGGMGGRDPVHIQLARAAGGQRWWGGQRAPGYGSGAAGGDLASQLGIGNIPGGASNVLAMQRQAFMGAELQNPRVQQLLMASTMAEVSGQGPVAALAYMESVTNRAMAEGRPLSSVLLDQRYYPGATKSKLGRQFGGQIAQQLSGLISKVMGGSNIARLATGNESGSVRSGGAPIMFNPGTGERFVAENWTRGWVASMARMMAQGGAQGVRQAFTDTMPALGQAAQQAAATGGRWATEQWRRLGRIAREGQPQLEGEADLAGAEQLGVPGGKRARRFLGARATADLAAFREARIKGREAESAMTFEHGPRWSRAARAQVETLGSAAWMQRRRKEQRREEAEREGLEPPGRGSPWASRSRRIGIPDEDREPGKLGAKSSEVKHSVEGSGKITVDVNAPRGTKVKAEGGGMFKSVEMNRNLSAQPANQRPAVEDIGEE